jgi:hypothetical protein
MNSATFIRAIRRFVLESAVTSVETKLKRPPGRTPSKELMEAAKWYGNLPERDQRLLHGVFEMVAHDSVFGFLCVLDGVRGIETNEVQSSFELFYSNGDERILLNNAEGEQLHDILNLE